MAGRFSTAKREKETASDAVSKIGDAFTSGAEAAEKQSRWKSFINSKPIQGICTGSKAFGKFVAAKTATAAKWAGTKTKDAGHDLWQGTKAFGRSFADSYRTRQEEKRTAKFIKGCEERGFVVMSQEECQNAYKSMSDMYKALYPAGPNSVDDIFAHSDAGDAISKMRDRIVHFNTTNDIEAAPAAFKPTTVPSVTSSADTPTFDDIAAKAEKDAKESPAAVMTKDIHDAAENGVKSDKLSAKLSQACSSLDERIAMIRESLDRMHEAKTEDEKSKIASDCIRDLRNHIVGMGNVLNEDVRDIDSPKAEANTAERGTEFEFAEPDSPSEEAVVDGAGI